MCPLSRWTEDSRWYRKASRAFLAANTTCWICGHPGADQVDHVIPVGPPHFGPKNDPANWRPAHGWRGCSQCPPNTSRDRRRNGQPQRCNQARGSKLQLPKPPVTSRRW